MKKIVYIHIHFSSLNYSHFESSFASRVQQKLEPDAFFSDVNKKSELIKLLSETEQKRALAKNRIRQFYW